MDSADRSEKHEVADEVARAAAADILDREAMRELGVGECDAAVLSLRSHIDTSVLAILVLQELGVKDIIAQAISRIIAGCCCVWARRA